MPTTLPAPTPAQIRETADPTERTQPIPLLVAGVTLLMVLAGAGYILFSEPFGMPDSVTAAPWPTRVPPPAPPARSTASSCSRPTASPATRPAAQGCPACSRRSMDRSGVQGDPRVLANILLHGVEGELPVKGTTYKGAGCRASPAGRRAELAAVANYVRASWSNQAAPVDAALFAAERKHNPRDKPFSGGAEPGAAGRSP